VKIKVSNLYFKCEREGRVPNILQGDVFDSVKKVGIVNPLLVAHIDDAYYVYIGNQRLAAAKELGIEEVECIVVESAEDIVVAMAQYMDI